MQPVEVNPVFVPCGDGWRRVVYAEDQTDDYLPLPSLRHDDGRVLTAWTLTADERRKIADGGDVFLVVHTFNKPLQPLRMGVDIADVVT